MTTKYNINTLSSRSPTGELESSSIVSLINNTNISKLIQLNVAEVIDVIYDNSHPDYKIDSDIGVIKYKIVNVDDGKTNDILYFAYPAKSDIIQYPIKHEIVIIIQLLGRNFYIDILNYLNRINNNSIPNITKYLFKDNQKYNNKSGPIDVGTSNKIDYGKTFIESNDKIKAIQPQEGDSFIYGRFGNVIKLGNYTKTENYPNIKIINNVKPKLDTKNYFITEDINRSASSIWLVSNSENSNLSLSTSQKSYFVKSAKNFPNKLDGDQILINSNRIILNAKSEEIGLFSNKGIILNTNGYIAIDSYNTIGITSLSNITIQSDNLYANNKNIYLGKGADEPLVLGNKLMTLLDNLIDVISNITHMTGTGESSPPVNKTELIRIKTKLNTILSKNNKTN